MSKNDWTRAALQRAGFVGWVRWSMCPAVLRTIQEKAGGIYVIYRAGPLKPTYLELNPAGRFRGDPSVSRDALEKNWVPDARVLYIGKANHGRLRKRLEEFVHFGRGGNKRHWGGRLIWQIEQSEELTVAWKAVPANAKPREIEIEMIAAFRKDYGKPPFANDPHLLGR